MKPTITVTRLRPGEKGLRDSLSLLTKKRVLVGIPATDAMERKREVYALSLKATGKRKARMETMAVESGVNNAELLYIHTHGSHLHNIPPRPVIEPALQDKENQQAILPELMAAAKAAMRPNADKTVVLQHLERAGIVAVNAVRAWFVSPKNGWPPNKPATIKAKGSSRPLIDTGALRQSITYVVVDAK